MFAASLLVILYYVFVRTHTSRHSTVLHTQLGKGSETQPVLTLISVTTDQHFQVSGPGRFWIIYKILRTDIKLSKYFYHLKDWSDLLAINF